MQPGEGARERRLVENTLAGDDRAFGQLVERYQAVVFGVAFRMLGDREEARDVAQEVFWRAYRGLGRFDLDRPMAPWLCRIATNLSLNRLRRGPPRPVRLDVPLPGQDEADRPLEVCDPGEGPGECLLRAETKAQIRAAILALAPIDRAVVELRHYQGLSYDEIAAALGLSDSSVKSRLFRARRNLRGQLAGLLAAENGSVMEAS